MMKNFSGLLAKSMLTLMLFTCAYAHAESVSVDGDGDTKTVEIQGLNTGVGADLYYLLSTAGFPFQQQVEGRDYHGDFIEVNSLHLGGVRYNATIQLKAHPDSIPLQNTGDSIQVTIDGDAAKELFGAMQSADVQPVGGIQPAGVVNLEFRSIRCTETSNARPEIYRCVLSFAP